MNMWDYNFIELVSKADYESVLIGSLVWWISVSEELQNWTKQPT